MSQQVKAVLVLRGRGVSVRLVEGGLQVLHDFRTWTVPTGVVRSVEARPGREVLIRFADVYLRGLPSELLISYSGADEGAELFVKRLQRGMRDLGAPNEAAQVTVETRRLRVRSHMATLGGGLFGYVGVCAVLGLLKGASVGAPVFGAVLGTALGTVLGLVGLLGVWILRLFWTHMLRDVVRLRRYGITVMGEWTNIRSAYGGNVRYHRVISYHTVEGEAFKNVSSCDTVGFSIVPRQTIEVTYDPANPRMVSGPLTFGHIFISAVCMCFGASFLLPGFAGLFLLFLLALW